MFTGHEVGKGLVGRKGAKGVVRNLLVFCRYPEPNQSHVFLHAVGGGETESGDGPESHSGRVSLIQRRGVQNTIALSVRNESQRSDCKCPRGGLQERGQVCKEQDEGSGTMRSTKQACDGWRGVQGRGAEIGGQAEKKKVQQRDRLREEAPRMESPGIQAAPSRPSLAQWSCSLPAAAQPHAPRLVESHALGHAAEVSRGPARSEVPPRSGVL